MGGREEPPPLTGFRVSTFCDDGENRVVYVRGDGPGVVVMHEIPGLTPQVIAFARRVADAGFCVYLPLLFGEVGRPISPRYTAQQVLRACISREFDVLASHRASPITKWLRALCRFVHHERGAQASARLGCA